VIGFMIWLWISTIVVPVGAEINAGTEHQAPHNDRKAKTIGISTRHDGGYSGLRLGTSRKDSSVAR
jgi:hypothetical protein